MGSRVGRQRRGRGARGPGGAPTGVGVWPQVRMRRRARIRLHAHACKSVRACVHAGVGGCARAWACTRDDRNAAAGHPCGLSNARNPWVRCGELRDVMLVCSRGSEHIDRKAMPFFSRVHCGSEISVPAAGATPRRHMDCACAFTIWRLWTLRTDIDDRVEAITWAAKVVHNESMKYERTILAYLTSHVGSTLSMSQFERLIRAELHWMTVSFFQYSERHLIWIEEAFRLLDWDLGLSLLLDWDLGLFDKSDYQSCYTWLEWHNFHVKIFAGKMEEVMQAHYRAQCADHALAFAMLGVPRLGQGSMWWPLNKDALTQITQALLAMFPTAWKHPNGTCPSPTAYSVSLDRALDLRCRRRTPAVEGVDDDADTNADCTLKEEDVDSDDDAESDFWALEDVYWEWTLGEEDEETLRAESASSDE